MRPQDKVEKVGGHLVVLNVRIILVQRSGTGPQLLDVLLLEEGLLLGVTTALEGPDPLCAHDAHQGTHHCVGQHPTFFEGEDGVEETFHTGDRCTSR